MPEKSWWNRSVQETASLLGTDLKRGLTAPQAKKAFEETGPNRLPEAKKISPWAIFFNQFNSVIIWVLLGACVVAGILQEWIDSFAILAIVILNALLGFIQEYRAEKSLAALRQMASPTSRVKRNGMVSVIPSDAIVPGDLVMLEAGDRIPADGRIIRSVQLLTQEAALTGESLPVEKQSTVLEKEEVELGDRKNMVFMGTVAVSGRGEVLITETGVSSELGKIAVMLQTSKEEKTPLQIRLDQLGRRLVVLFLVIVAIVFGLGLLRGNPLVEMFLMALSLAVAAIPEGLPAVVTVTLALGVRRMVKRHALIRRLPSVETLGCATVICSDKTGTLTKNEMTVQRIWANSKIYSVTGVGYAPEGEFLEAHQPLDLESAPELEEALRIGVLCNNSDLYAEGKIWKVAGDPTEGAFLAAAKKAGFDKERLVSAHPVISEVPFDSDRKRMSILRETPQGAVLYVKGAPDVILNLSEKILIKGSDVRLSADDRRRVEQTNDELAGQAFRVLAVARRKFLEGEKPDEKRFEEALTFVGLFAMIDPPRPEVRSAIEKCREAGIIPVMITGDHKQTALAVARELGMLGKNSLALNGTELNELDEKELAAKVARVTVYARVTAEHKLKVIHAWKKKGAVVAMTGDGVNDAPAVKEADIGVAMGITGTDVTKEASDMIITDDNFASIVNAVEEGRGVYDNIVKFIKFLLSYNLAEIFVILIAVLIGLKDRSGQSFIPLTAVQILWMNLVTDGLPAMALGVDPRAPDAMRRPPRKPSETIFNRGFLFHTCVISIIVTIASL
ncbi:MAG TPA: HAD-IC family P-type ATPase, partial [bacterium]|nr:HAD-IC family P-type ATPase [bacterium]